MWSAQKCGPPENVNSLCGRERRFYNGQDRKVNGTTPTLASLLRPWIRCFTIIIPA